MEGRLKIGTGLITELEDMNLYIADSDQIFAPPHTDMEEQFFPELGKSTIYPEVQDKPFDFKFKLGAVGDVNEIVSTFFASVRGKQVEFYDDYSRIKIVGYVKTPAPQDKYNPIVSTFPVIIRVNDPSKCDFNIQL